MSECMQDGCRAAFAKRPGHHTLAHVDPTTPLLDKLLPSRPRPTGKSYQTMKNAPTGILKQQPVDILCADHSREDGTEVFVRSEDREPRWTKWLEVCPISKRPTMVVEVWNSTETLFNGGALGKPRRKRMRNLGYEQRSRHVSLPEIGSSVQQTRLVILYLRVASPLAERFNVDFGYHPVPGDGIRPMENLLRPLGLVPPLAYKLDVSPEAVPFASTDVMPATVGSRIRDERGVRRLQADELARGLDIPKAWGELTQLHGKVLNQLPGLHLWEWLGYGLFDRSDTEESVSSSPKLEPEVTAKIFESTEGNWSWEAADLSPGSPWMLQRLRNLTDACKGLPDRVRHFTEGVESLEIHRNNYGTEGAQQLRVLWWEFPPERWLELRTGCSMNFLETPADGLTPNSNLVGDELAAAVEFTEELKSLLVIGPPRPGTTVRCNAPLFVLPKPGQSGQWRVIADMKTGGQNECIGRDPVFLRKQGDILEQLYAGGHSAVADASKYFYQFPTKSEEQEFLGFIHPGTGELLVYYGLPMGSANSPAVAGRMGASFVRALKESRPDLFGGVAVENSWRRTFAKEGVYDDRLGHGFTRLGSDGLPPVLVFFHVDDFLVHGPTYEKTAAAMTALMDAAVDVGMLFNPSKVTPPAHCVKYCGYLYDTTEIPTLRIPEDKLARSLAILDYVLSQPGEMSGLALSVVYGTLQLLVAASPSNVGQTYLRQAYDSLYEGSEEQEDSRYLLYRRIVISPGALADLQWWQAALRAGLCRVVRYDKSGMLVATFGDGSGTGSGGTVQMPDFTVTQWMGQWKPHVHSKSSNYRELYTLLATLQRIWERDPTSVRGMTLFYFTDNSVCYHVVQGGSSKSPTLHALVKEIKLMEVKMGCRLEAVHVPGLVLICQGTDALSRGVWVSPAQGFNPVEVTAQVFAGGIHDDRWSSVLPSLYTEIPLGGTIRHWSQCEQFSLVGRQHTIWLPPPLNWQVTF
jgi:hypothetical protein